MYCEEMRLEKNKPTIDKISFIIYDFSIQFELNPNLKIHNFQQKSVFFIKITKTAYKSQELARTSSFPTLKALIYYNSYLT